MTAGTAKAITTNKDLIRCMLGIVNLGEMQDGDSRSESKNNRVPVDQETSVRFERKGG